MTSGEFPGPRMVSWEQRTKMQLPKMQQKQPKMNPSQRIGMPKWHETSSKLQRTNQTHSNTNKQVIFHFFIWLETISSCYTSRIIGSFSRNLLWRHVLKAGLWFHGLSTMTGPVHVHQTHSSGHLKRVTVTQRLIISVGCFSWVSWHHWRW